MKIYQSMPYTAFIRRNSSELIHSILGLTGQYASGVVQMLLRTISDGIVCIFILGMLAWTNITALLLLIFLY